MPKRHRSSSSNHASQQHESKLKPHKRPRNSTSMDSSSHTSSSNKKKKTLKNVGMVPKSKEVHKYEQNAKNMILRTDPHDDSSSESESTNNNKSLIQLLSSSKKGNKNSSSHESDEDDESLLSDESGAVFISDLINEDDDEDEFSDEDEDNKMDNRSSDSEDEEEQKISIDEQRIKTAKQFLAKMKDMQPQSSDSTQNIEDELKHRRDLLIQNKDSKLFDITKGLQDGTLKTEQIFLKGHKNTVTCCSLVENDPHVVYTGAKDCCILRWDLHAQKKVLFSKGRRNQEVEGGGHEGQILSMDVSHDGKYLVSAGMDNVVKVWDTRSGQLLEDLDGHYAPITGLSFRKNSYEFYSCSEDRTVRVWDAEEQAFASALYGHTDAIYDLHALDQETCITGGADTSLRFWKVDQETQLLFKGHTYSVDCTRMIHQSAFLTGSQDGSVCFWGKAHRKPMHRFPDAHGGKWISSVAAVPYGNLAASGSHDGYIRFYRAEPKRGLQMITSIPQHGYVNCMEFAMRPGASHNRFMVYGVGLDHRLGRWNRLRKVKNGLGIVKFVES